MIYINYKKVNEKLNDDPSLLNKDAENEWIFEIKLSDIKEIDELMDSDNYAKFISK